MNAEVKNRYFQELTLNLQHEGFTVKSETEAGLLPVELDGQRLCLALETGGVRYWKEDAVGDARSAALEKATAIVKTTAAYMGQMEAAPPLTANGLEGDYRLLAEFNNMVLAGHPTASSQSSFDFVSRYAENRVRSGLIPRGALFTPEQLTEVHRSIQETLENHCPLRVLVTAAECNSAKIQAIPMPRPRPA